MCSVTLLSLDTKKENISCYPRPTALTWKYEYFPQSYFLWDLKERKPSNVYPVACKHSLRVKIPSHTSFLFAKGTNHQPSLKKGRLLEYAVILYFLILYKTLRLPLPFLEKLFSVFKCSWEVFIFPRTPENNNKCKIFLGGLKNSHWVLKTTRD